MKQVFRFLIAEAPYLIDDKAMERCEGKDAKEQHKIKIDSVRKSLGIEDMQDVELLVETLYKFQEKYDSDVQAKLKRMEEEDEAEEAEASGNPDAPNPNSLNDVKKTSNEATLNGAAEGNASREEEEVDENKLNLDPELLTAALVNFDRVRDARDLENGLIASKNKNKKKKDQKSVDKTEDAARLK